MKSISEVVAHPNVSRHETTKVATGIDRGVMDASPLWRFFGGHMVMGGSVAQDLRPSYWVETGPASIHWEKDS